MNKNINFLETNIKYYQYDTIIFLVEMNNCGLIFTPDKSKYLFRISWLSLFSSIYAIKCGHYDMAVVPGGIFLTSINHWRNPAFISWRRTCDIYYVRAGLLYQLIRSYNAQYAKKYYLCTLLGISFFPVSWYYYNKRQYWKSVISHGMLHAICNVANVILYTGYIPSTRFSSVF